MVKNWDATYKNDPADIDNLSQGAERIRDLKYAIEERGNKEHTWGFGSAETEGNHKAGSARVYYATNHTNVPTQIGDSSNQQGRLRLVNEGAGTRYLQFLDTLAGAGVVASDFLNLDACGGDWNVAGALNVVGVADFAGDLTAVDAYFTGSVVIGDATHPAAFLKVGENGDEITELRIV